jgi:hypothetical protein
MGGYLAPITGFLAGLDQVVDHQELLGLAGPRKFVILSPDERR